MGRKKGGGRNTSSDNGEYVSRSSVDNPPRYNDREEEKEAEQEEKSCDDTVQEKNGQQVMFSPDTLDGVACSRDVDMAVTVQVGTTKIELLKAKDKPVDYFWEMAIKSLLISRRNCLIMDAALDIPEANHKKAHDLRNRLRLCIQEYNAELQKDKDAKEAKRKQELEAHRKEIERQKKEADEANRAAREANTNAGEVIVGDFAKPLTAMEGEAPSNF